MILNVLLREHQTISEVCLCAEEGSADRGPVLCGTVLYKLSRLGIHLMLVM